MNATSPLTHRLLIILTTLLPQMCGTHALLAAEVPPLEIGTRRELFVDHLLIGELKDTALKLHAPHLAPPVSPPRPNGHYATVLRAADKFQFYYPDLAAVAAADPAFIHIKAFDLPPQREKLVLDTAGVLKLGEVLARNYLEHL